MQNGANFAFDQAGLHVLDAPLNQFDALSTAVPIAAALQTASGSTGSYLVFVQLTDGGPVGAVFAAGDTLAWLAASADGNVFWPGC